MSDYDAILNMTDEQAADILEDLFFNGVKVGGRGYGKTTLQLTYNTAIIKALNKLRGISPSKKLYSQCIRCGRALKNPVAQERGYGDICWQKQLHDNQTKLF